MRILGLIFILVVGFFIYGQSESNRGGAESWKSLSSDMTRCRNQVNSDKGSGVVINTSFKPGSAQADVDEYKWKQISNGDKIAVALGIYCLHGGPDGKYQVMVYGYRDGKLKGALTNGQWTGY